MPFVEKYQFHTSRYDMQDVFDNAATRQYVDDAVANAALALMITDTASGATVSIPDGANAPVRALSIEVNPVQSGSGTPYPAGGGANIWDEEWEVGSYNEDGTEYPSTARIRTKNYIPVTPSTTYYFHTDGATADVHYYDTSKAHISFEQKTNATFTTPNNCYFVRFCMSVAYGTTYEDNLAINYPSSVTTYSPYSNIRPISGWTDAEITRLGSNIAKAYSGTYAQHSVNFVFNGDNTATLSGTASNNVYKPNSTEAASADAVFTLKAGTYKVSASGISGVQAQLLKSDGTVLATQSTATLTEDTSVFVRLFVPSGTSTGGGTVAIALQDYTTYTVDLNGTVYGGTVDVVGGTKEETMAIVDLGELTWTQSGAIFRADLSGIKIPASNNAVPNLLCSIYSPIAVNDYSSSSNNVVMVSQAGQVWTADSRYSDAASYKTAMTGIYLIYELATPTSGTITPVTDIATEYGDNTVSCDTGDVDLEYRADTKLYIDKKIAEAV